jgi:tRNA A37 threonylcarbamoyladenosine synthetase subunit TsaC/SUA5/YrdC
LRIPYFVVAQALMAELGEPLLSSTRLLPGDDMPLNDPNEIRERLEQQVALVIDAGSCGIVPTTVVDLTGDAPLVTRRGKGGTAPFNE